jgi:monoamine oxidase
MFFRRKRSVKTAALQQLQEAFKKISQQNLPEENYSPSRRKFVGDMAKTAAFIGFAGLYEACVPANKITQPVIAIVGGGIAGLHAAYILKQAGYTAQIYEGSGRAGGRIFTVDEMMAPGLWTEMGGEFIDTDHTDMINLAKHFNLPLLDRHAASETALKEYAYFFGNKFYYEKDILEALRPVAAQMKKDIASLSPDISYTKHSDVDVKFDNMNIEQYVEQLGITGWFKTFINKAFTAEYGMETAEQSAISFLSLFDPGDGASYKLLGSSDERFSIIGGGQKLCDALAKEVKDNLNKEHLLTAISQNNSKKYVLNFTVGASQKKEVAADIVLLTLPFSTLRDVDIRLNLPAWKMSSIKDLGYGTNSKLFLGVNERIWRKQNYAGYTFSDNGVINGYDNTQLQNNNSGAGGFTVFLGGKAGAELGAQDMGLLKKKFVRALNEIFPGFGATFNNKFMRWDWPGYVFSKGSYTSYKTGQYTTLSGTQFPEVDNLYFAGEHCSYGFQGFMNGGAETGRRAAQNIIKKLKG